MKIFKILSSQFEKFQQNLIISKSTTIYHYSSTMAYVIGQSQKLGAGELVEL